MDIDRIITAADIERTYGVSQRKSEDMAANTRRFYNGGVAKGQSITLKQVAVANNLDPDKGRLSPEQVADLIEVACEEVFKILDTPVSLRALKVSRPKVRAAIKKACKKHGVNELVIYRTLNGGAYKVNGDFISSEKTENNNYGQ